MGEKKGERREIGRMIERENGHIAQRKRLKEKQKGDEGSQMKENTTREMGYKPKERPRRLLLLRRG